jgi:hypothetical protein
MVNQYPNENAITYKHLLVETLEDYFGDLCHEWLSPSYDLDKLSADNLPATSWIAKTPSALKTTFGSLSHGTWLEALRSLYLAT